MSFEKELSSLKEECLLALFSDYEALIPRGKEPSLATLSRPTLDEIVIHLGAQGEM